MRLSKPPGLPGSITIPLSVLSYLLEHHLLGDQSMPMPPSLQVLREPASCWANIDSQQLDLMMFLVRLKASQGRREMNPALRAYVLSTVLELNKH